MRAVRSDSGIKLESMARRIARTRGVAGVRIAQGLAGIFEPMSALPVVDDGVELLAEVA